MHRQHLILGGANSGKSLYAENLALSLEKECIYIATAQIHDQEMRDKVEKHQARRGSEWRLVEAAINLADALRQNDREDCVILVDCLTLWVTNCLLERAFSNQRDALLACVKTLKCDLLMVSNEVGSGIVPLGELNRAFVQASGALHQSLGQLVGQVSLIVAGLPLKLKAS